MQKTTLITEVVIAPKDQLSLNDNHAEMIKKAINAALEKMTSEKRRDKDITMSIKIIIKE